MLPNGKRLYSRAVKRELNFQNSRNMNEEQNLNKSTKKAWDIADVGRSAITYEQFQEALKIVKNYKNEIENYYKQVEKQYKELDRFIGVTKETRIMDIDDIDVRTLNCLKAGQYLDWDTKVKDLENVKISELIRLRNFGEKSLQKIKEICFYAGVKLLP